jgi:uncharacterized membrane protein YcjF (UPF0283 family)
VVDLSAMWIHNRTGKNSAISYGPGTVLFALFVAATLVGLLWNVVQDADASVWVLLLVVFGVIAAVWRGLWNLDSENREYRRLAALDERTEHEAELQRLRAKDRA